tara:strand:+ start:56 stop:1618 length:1563 start_codon:yes stop_codon:yes gene_type:complete
MDKNENFKNVLNNLKNLSGGMAPDPKSDPAPAPAPALDQNSEGDDQVSNANNEIKPIPGSFIGCISLLGIFSFLNPFFYILKYTVMKKNGDLSTWIAIHSVIFIGIIITFFCFLFLNMISNVSTKESDTNISNVTLFRVFFSIIFLLLFATTIMLSISESCNSNVTLEEEEEMFTGNYEIDKTCKNLKYMNEENGKTYVSMLLGMFVTQVVMCFALLGITISSDDILKKLNVYPIKLDKDKASKIINDQFTKGLKIRIDEIKNKLANYLQEEFKNEYDNKYIPSPKKEKEEQEKEEKDVLKNSLEELKKLKEFYEGLLEGRQGNIKKILDIESMPDDIPLLIDFLTIDNLNDFDLKNVDENYVIFKLKKNDHLLFDKTEKKINILLTEDTTVGIKFFKSDIKFDIDEDIKTKENTEEDIEKKNNKTKTSVGEDLIVLDNNSFIFRYEEKSRIQTLNKIKPSFYVYTTITLDENFKIKSSKHRYEVKDDDENGKKFLNTFKFQRKESKKECMINDDPNQKI